MPWTEVSGFLARLRTMESVSALALEFVVLTDCRSGEVLRSVRDGQLPVYDGPRLIEKRRFGQFRRLGRNLAECTAFRLQAKH